MQLISLRLYSIKEAQGVRTEAVGLLHNVMLPKLEATAASSNEMTALSIIISWLILTIPNVVIGISRSEGRASKYN